jgi:hypothetical protein
VYVYNRNGSTSKATAKTTAAMMIINIIIMTKTTMMTKTIQVTQLHAPFTDTHYNVV